jgi:hypothetical protein
LFVHAIPQTPQFAGSSRGVQTPLQHCWPMPQFVPSSGWGREHTTGIPESASGSQTWFALQVQLRVKSSCCPSAAHGSNLHIVVTVSVYGEHGCWKVDGREQGAVSTLPSEMQRPSAHL